MDEQTQWEKTSGYAPGRTTVKLTCDKEDRQLWTREAARNGYTSRSKYLYDLILEARSVRQSGFLGAHASKDRLEELQAKVDSLEHQLEQERQKRGGRIEVDDPTFLHQFLSDEYQELPELMQAVVESGALDDLIRKRVEDQLYFLASQGSVEYEPGWGWKRSETED